MGCQGGSDHVPSFPSAEEGKSLQKSFLEESNVWFFCSILLDLERACWEKEFGRS